MAQKQVLQFTAPVEFISEHARLHHHRFTWNLDYNAVDHFIGPQNDRRADQAFVADHPDFNRVALFGDRKEGGGAAIEEIVAAAKRVNTSVVMFTEHPSDKFDYFKDGHRGMKDDVLMIPGAETGGFLVFPNPKMGSIFPPMEAHGQPSVGLREFANLVQSRGGLIFLSHLEERMDWDIRHITGTEIYNIHADFKDEKNLQKAMRNPIREISSSCPGLPTSSMSVAMK